MSHNASPLLCRLVGATLGRGRRVFSTMSAGHATASHGVPPSISQLWKQGVASAVPMIGFGFMDNTIMIHAGEYIDNTFGVAFGLSTLTAAAMGQIMSDFSGVLFGGTVGDLAARCGLPDPQLSNYQMRTRSVRWVSIAGAAVGVLCGCTLGERSTTAAQERSRIPGIDRCHRSRTPAELERALSRIT